MNGIILLPSLDRSEKCKYFFQCYNETESTIGGLLLVDSNDPQLEAYKALELPKDWELVITKARSMGEKFLEVKERYWEKDFICILNDDYAPRTKKWDVAVASQITGTNFVATNDNFQAPNRMCGAICISGKIFRTLGWVFPPGINHLYSDSVWEYIATNAQCCNIMMDVMVEHLHGYKDEKYKDATFEKVNSKESWESDKTAFEYWLKNNAATDVQKIKDLQPKTGVMLCTPSHDGNVCILFAQGLSEATLQMQMNNIHWEFCRIVGSSLVTHARNQLVDMFMKSRCQKLLFVDSDQGFTAQDVFRLLGSSRRIIAGVVPHKRFPLNLNFEPLPEDDKYFKDTANKSLDEYMALVQGKADQLGEIQVNRAGTGFMMIDRSVFEIMKPHVNKYLAYDNPGSTEEHYEYFLMGGSSGKYKGEDWFFCQLAKQLQIPIYINAFVSAPHQGSYVFQIPPIQVQQQQVVK